MFCFGVRPMSADVCAATGPTRQCECGSSGTRRCLQLAYPHLFPHRWHVWPMGRCLGEGRTGWSVCIRSIESSLSFRLPPHPLMGQTHPLHRQQTSHFSVHDTFHCSFNPNPSTSVTSLDTHNECSYFLPQGFLSCCLC